MKESSPGARLAQSSAVALSSQLQIESHLLKVTERVRATTDEVHPGWIRATSILLRGMERLQRCEAADQRVISE